MLGLNVLVLNVLVLNTKIEKRIACMIIGIGATNSLTLASPNQVITYRVIYNI